MPTWAAKGIPGMHRQPIIPPRRIGKISDFVFRIFRPTQKTAWDGPKWGREVFFRLIQTLPTFWAERIWILISFMFDIVWISNFWISRFPDLQIPRFPGPQISKFPNSKISRFPDFQTPLAAALVEFSDPNLTPLPTHPGIKYVARSPCCT